MSTPRLLMTTTPTQKSRAMSTPCLRYLVTFWIRLSTVTHHPSPQGYATHLLVLCYSFVFVKWFSVQNRHTILCTTLQAKQHTDQNDPPMHNSRRVALPTMHSSRQLGRVFCIRRVLSCQIPNRRNFYISSWHYHSSFIPFWCRTVMARSRLACRIPRRSSSSMQYCFIS